MSADASLLPNPDARSWPLTATPGETLPDLHGVHALVEDVRHLTDELSDARNRWYYEYGRVLKAMYGYEWERGTPAESNEALLAAETAFGKAKANLVARLGVCGVRQ